MKYCFFLLALFFFLFFPHTTFAAIKNCETVSDLPNILPSDEDWEKVYHKDWNEAFLLRADDGSVWQRAVLSHTDKKLVLRGKKAIIQGVGEPESPLQVFVFTPQKNTQGKIARPTGDGVCFTPGKTKKSGEFSFVFPAVELWSRLGSEIVFDVYTRLSGDWSQYTRSDTNQNFFISTHVSLKPLSVSLPPVKQGSPMRRCHALCSDNSREELYEAVALTPNNRISPFLPAYFIRSLRIARNPETLYYTQVDGSPLASAVDLEYAKNILSVSLAAEWLKRVLLPSKSIGTLFGGIGLGDGLSPLRIRSIDNGTEQVDEKYAKLLQGIKALLTNTAADRNQVASEIANVIVVNDQFAWKADGVISSLLQLFPGKSTEDTWVQDFVHIMRFWTGSQQENPCLLVEDRTLLTSGITFAEWDIAQTVRCNMNRTASLGF